jgi:hypothetical protein
MLVSETFNQTFVFKLYTLNIWKVQNFYLKFGEIISFLQFLSRMEGRIM